MKYKCGIWQSGIRFKQIFDEENKAIIDLLSIRLRLKERPNKFQM